MLDGRQLPILQDQTIYGNPRNIDVANNQGNRAGQNYNQGNPATIIGGNAPPTGNRYTGSGNYRCNNGAFANKFVIWGINHDSDDDSQALCAYDNNLANGKMDSWQNVISTRNNVERLG